MSPPDSTPDESQPSKPAPKSSGQSFTRTIKTAGYVVIAVLTTIFLLANSQSVEVDYIFGSAQTPLAIALAIAVVLGALLALGAVAIRKVSHRGDR